MDCTTGVLLLTFGSLIGMCLTYIFGYLAGHDTCRKRLKDE